MKGRHATPTGLKILRLSTKKAEKLLRSETPAPGPLFDPPEWMTKDQKLDWEYAIENAPRDVLRRADKAVLAGFIIAQDTHKKASIALNRMELLVRSPKQDLPLQNPYLPIVNRQMLLMMRAASELGFTPCSRARIDAGRTESPESFDGWDEVTEVG